MTNWYFSKKEVIKSHNGCKPSRWLQLKKILMKTIKLLLVLILFYGCGNSQERKHELVGNLTTDLENLIPNGNHKVDIIDGIVMDSRYEILYEKFIIAMQENKEWFLEQQKITEKTNNPVPYHPNIGMSEKEYEEFQILMNEGPGMEMVKSGTAMVHFEREKDLIKMSGTDRLNFINEILIDLENNIAFIGDVKLDIFKEIEVDTDKNGLKSKWKGYQWLFESSNLENRLQDLESMKDVEKMSIKLYKLTIGRLDKDGTTYMEFTESELNNGVRIKNIKIPIKF